MIYQFRVNKLKDDISRKVHSTSLDKIKGINPAIREGAINMLSQIDPPETQIEILLDSEQYRDDIYIASIPEDAKQDKITTIKPASVQNLFVSDKATYVPYVDFILNRDRNTFTIQYINGEKKILYFKLRDDNYKLVYYTSQIFIEEDDSGEETVYTRHIEPTSDDDIIGLEAEAYNILLYETLRNLAQQTQGEDSGFDITFFESELFGTGNKGGLYRQYKSRYRSNAKRRVARYY